MNAASSNIIIVCALACEAKPVINFYKLKRIHNSNPFEIYQNQAANMYLIISGVGKLNAAAAVSYIYHYPNAKSHSVFINIGIAGSAQHEVGKLIIADKIIDKATNKKYFPYLGPIPAKFQSDSVTTFDKPCINEAYPSIGAADMEAAAVFHAARIFVTQEQIIVLKVISDTPDNNISHINKSMVNDLIHTVMQEIATAVDCARELSERSYYAFTQPMEKVEAQLDIIASKYHVTNYQQHQLRERLQCVLANNPDLNIDKYIKQSSNTKSLISLLMGDT